MRKIKLFVIAVLALFSFNLYADAKAIKESKLTNLSYVKKICKITETYILEDDCFYVLDGGNGALLFSRDNKFKICAIVKDGKLYGRIFCKIDGRRTVKVTYNLHDKECSIKGIKVPEEAIKDFTSMSSETLKNFAKESIDCLN